jgi:hypothetical protein
MSNVLKTINAAFNVPSTPITKLPPPLVLVGAKLRPGLSARTIAARIISRQVEAGAPAGDIFSEENNVMESMMVIMIQEIITALQTDAKIEIVIAPGIKVITQGAGNLGGPVISQGATTSIASGDGVIR